MGNFVYYDTQKDEQRQRASALLQHGLDQYASQAHDENMFKLQKAAHRNEFDYEFGKKHNQSVQDQVRNLEQFTTVYPEYADTARKAGRPLTSGEVSDLRETARQNKKSEDAANSQQKLANYVVASGDKEAQAYFDATGKLHPKLTRAGTAADDPKKSELKDLDEQLKAYDRDLRYAALRKQANSFDHKRGETDPEYKKQRSATVGDALNGKEGDYWNAVNDMMATQARIQSVNQRRAELAGGNPLQPSTAGSFSPPPPQVSGPIQVQGAPVNQGTAPITGQPAQPGQPSTAAPGAPIQPMAAPAQATPEMAQNHLMYSAARLKVQPARIAQMPAPPVSYAAQLKAQAMRAYSDPTAQRQAFYDAMVQAGFDPTKLPVPDAQPAQGMAAHNPISLER